MLTTHKFLRMGILALILGVLIGCAHLGNLGNLPINLRKRNVLEISDLQQKQDLDSTVYLQGKVVKIVPFLDSGAYQLQDDTGSIWVFTTNSLPAEGDRLVVKGEIQYQKITQPDRELGEFYLKEIEQLEGEDYD